MASDTLADRLGGILRDGYGITVAQTRRIPAGTQADNYALHDRTGQRWFAKVYQPNTDLAYERANLQATLSAAEAGVPVAAVVPSHAGDTILEHQGTAMSLWQWCDTDAGASIGPVTPEQAHTIGSVLARLHRHLTRFDGQAWPVAQPHYHRHTLHQIRQRFAALHSHIAAIPTRSQWDEDNLDRIQRRLRDLAWIPALLETAVPPLRAVVHGDYVRPNWLIHHGQLRAVIDFRIKYDDPVRELGRAAFDIATIATSPDWLAVAQAALAGYLEHGGIVSRHQIYGCVRLALLHSLASTYPGEDLYFTPAPEHLQADLREYWDNRAVATRTLLDALGEVDAMTARLTRTTPAATTKPLDRHSPAEPHVDLAVVAAARQQLLDTITTAARDAGVHTLLLTHPTGSAAADLLSGFSFTVVPASTGGDGTPPSLLPHRLLQPLPLLFSAPSASLGGSGLRLCVQVAGWPLSTDWIVGPLAITSGATVLFGDAEHKAAEAPTAGHDSSCVRAPASAAAASTTDSGLWLLHSAASLYARRQFAEAASILTGSQTICGQSEARRLIQDAATMADAADVIALQRWVKLSLALADTAGWKQQPTTCDVLRLTSKSTVAAVETPGNRLVVKLSTSSDPYWRSLARREQSFHRKAAATPTLLRLVPLMLYGGDGATVLSWLRGQPLHRDRYPSEPVPPHHVAVALRALTQFAACAWEAIPDDTGTADYVHSLARQQLDPIDAASFDELLKMLRDWSPQHGDALPSNLLIAPGPACHLVDFEHVSSHPPGYDYATLRTCMAGQPPHITGMIDTFAERHAGKLAYLASRIAVLARERHIHHLLPADHHTVRRGLLLDDEWANATAQLRSQPSVAHLQRQRTST